MENSILFFFIFETFPYSVLWRYSSLRPGVSIDTERSNATSLHLANLTVASTGRYRCVTLYVTLSVTIYVTSWQVRGQHRGPDVQHREQIRRPPRHRAPETASKGISRTHTELRTRTIITKLTKNISSLDLKSWQRVSGLPGPRWLCEPPLRVWSVKTSLWPLMGHQWCTGEVLKSNVEGL